jgi:hypothetical protein
VCSNSSFSFKFPRLVTYSQKHDSKIFVLYSPILPRPRFHTFDSPVYFWQLRRTFSSLARLLARFLRYYRYYFFSSDSRSRLPGASSKIFCSRSFLRSSNPHTQSISKKTEEEIARSLARWLAGRQRVQQSKSQERHTQRSPARKPRALKEVTTQ